MLYYFAKIRISPKNTQKNQENSSPFLYNGRECAHLGNFSSTHSMNTSGEGVKQALLDLLEATDEDGHRIFSEKGQWYAVYKVLSECHGYPTNIREFCDIMKNWGMDGVSPACAYENIRKIPNQILIPTNKVTLWHNYQDKAEAKFKKQVIVANKLMELLEK